MIIGIVLGIIGLICVALALCYFLVPGLRNRDREKVTREKAAAEDVENMIVSEKKKEEGLKPIDREKFVSSIDKVIEEGEKQNISLDDIEAYFIAAEQDLFGRWHND